MSRLGDVALVPFPWRAGRALLAIVLLAAFAGLGADLPVPPESFRILSYNVHNFFPATSPQAKSDESRRRVIEIIAGIAPNVMVLIEVGGAPAIEDIRRLLAEQGRSYRFASVVQGEDKERMIALLADIDPVEVRHDVEASYNLGGRHVRVQRGFAHCVFEWRNGYRLQLLGVHLKSKMYDPLGQTDMRRYEARQLRYKVDRLLDDDPAANILVVGDFNDTPDSSPISTLCGRRHNPERQLYDLRPQDATGMAWTHLWQAAETYSRIDYAFASYALVSEIQWPATLIPQSDSWFVASDHRPLLITLRPQDKAPDPAVFSSFVRNVRTTVAAPSPAGDGRVLGPRKARRQDGADAAGP